MARKYQAEGIKIDQIVIAFFHWTVQGDWKFDKTYWPDPKAMVDELHAMGIKVIVSVCHLQISMHDYIKSLYQEAHENGSPLLRAMFYEFPMDEKCWELQDQYMFGAKYLVAPILRLNQFRRDVYLPAGGWKLTSTGEVFQGGQTVTADAPIEYMPVFEKL